MPHGKDVPLVVLLACRLDRWEMGVRYVNLARELEVVGFAMILEI